MKLSEIILINHSIFLNFFGSFIFLNLFFRYSKDINLQDLNLSQWKSFHLSLITCYEVFQVSLFSIRLIYG